MLKKRYVAAIAIGGAFGSAALTDAIATAGVADANDPSATDALLEDTENIVNQGRRRRRRRGERRGERRRARTPHHSRRRDMSMAPTSRRVYSVDGRRHGRRSRRRELTNREGRDILLRLRSFKPARSQDGSILDACILDVLEGHIMDGEMKDARKCYDECLAIAEFLNNWGVDEPQAQELMKLYDAATRGPAQAPSADLEQRVIEMLKADPPEYVHRTLLDLDNSFSKLRTKVANPNMKVVIPPLPLKSMASLIRVMGPFYDAFCV